MAHDPCLRHTDRLPAAGSAGGRVPGCLAGIKELNGLHKAAERVLLQFVSQTGGFCGDGSRDVVSEDILGLCVRLGRLVAARLAVVAAKAAATEE